MGLVCDTQLDQALSKSLLIEYRALSGRIWGSIEKNAGLFWIEYGSLLIECRALLNRTWVSFDRI